METAPIITATLSAPVECLVKGYSLFTIEHHDSGTMLAASELATAKAEPA